MLCDGIHALTDFGMKKWSSRGGEGRGGEGRGGEGRGGEGRGGEGRGYLNTNNTTQKEGGGLKFQHLKDFPNLKAPKGSM